MDKLLSREQRRPDPPDEDPPDEDPPDTRPPTDS